MGGRCDPSIHVPSFGIVVLLIALLATLWVRNKDKERRHAELLDATRGSAAEKTPTAEERLAEIDRLRASGNLSTEEYEAKR